MERMLPLQAGERVRRREPRSCGHNAPAAGGGEGVISDSSEKGCLPVEAALFLLQRVLDFPASAFPLDIRAVIVYAIPVRLAQTNHVGFLFYS